jgi:hypothetical protein
VRQQRSLVVRIKAVAGALLTSPPERRVNPRVAQDKVVHQVVEAKAVRDNPAAEPRAAHKAAQAKVEHKAVLAKGIPKVVPVVLRAAALRVVPELQETLSNQKRAR